MIDYSSFLNKLTDTNLAHWQAPLRQQLDDFFAQLNDGNLPRLLQTLNQLPDVSGIQVDYSTVSIHSENPLSTHQKAVLTAAFKALLPWRKGPFNCFGVVIDAEWRCDLKWQRLMPHIQPLRNRLVLDVGCGNGYYGWRMKAAGAHLVAGIDPSWLSVVQHLAINHFVGDTSHAVLPLTLEQLTPNLSAFDTVFSMGVLYHRRSPLQHLDDLRSALRPGGELVLETLVIEGNDQSVLVPNGRYARMNNVWFIPSTTALKGWLQKIGFEQVRIVDVTTTTSEEQRTTPWKPGQSLKDYLKPDNRHQTIEGHPAPMRAILVAQKPADQQRLSRYRLE